MLKIPKEWEIYFDVNKIKQEISSSKTARLQKPKTLKIISDMNLISNGKKLLDVGCGSGNVYFKEATTKLGFEYYGCDPFNQTKENNIHAIMNCMNGQADLVTLNNVLNTIKEKSIRKSILKQCKNAINKETGIMLILTYEGEKLASEKKQEKETGVRVKNLTPIKTRDGWQNRMKTEVYLDEVQEVFKNSKVICIKGVKFIIASENLEKIQNLTDRKIDKKSTK